MLFNVLRINDPRFCSRQFLRDTSRISEVKVIRRDVLALYIFNDSCSKDYNRYLSGGAIGGYVKACE